MRFACPTCGNNLTASSSKAGTIMSCPACNQLVQVPGAPPSAAPSKTPAAAAPSRSSREGPKAFWALCRLFLRLICFGVIVVALFSFAVNVAGANTAEQTAISVHTLVWILGAYYVTRIMDDVGKAIEDVISRVRRRKR
jgi:hypothetical protein